MTKAYNIIGSIFLGKGWRAMGFESKWVDLTMNCIKTVLYLALMKLGSSSLGSDGLFWL